VRLAGYEEAAGVVDPGFVEFVQFFAQGNRVDHNTVADDVLQPRAKNARRHRMEHELFTVENKRMPGVGASLEAGDDVVLGGKNVNNLSFAFVSPLET